MRHTPVLAVLALAACSENNLDLLPTEECTTEAAPPGLVRVDPECRFVDVGTFTPVLENRYSLFTLYPGSTSVLMTPLVVQVTDDDGDGDIDGDDIPDIIVATYDQAYAAHKSTLRALSGDGSGVHWTGAFEAIGFSTGMAAGDIDNDGVVEIISISPDYRVQAWEHDGSFKWQSAPYTRSDVGQTAPYPALADLDGDGTPEILLGRVVLNADGSQRWKGTGGIGGNVFGPVSFGIDMEDDGLLEVVAGSTIYEHDGTVRWTAQAPDGPSAVADFDSDGKGELVITNSAGRVWLVDDDGTVLWQAETDNGGGGPPTIADFDGDGQPEIGVAGRAAYTVVDTDGSLLWSNGISDDLSGGTGSAVFDFEGDGVAEVVYADEETLWVFSGVDGTVRMQATDHASLTANEYPVVADVDGDGQAELITVNNKSRQGSTGLGVKIFGDADESWVAAPKYWNQHAFSLTNATPTGEIPAAAESNWFVGHNSFRSGGLTLAPTGLLYDLQVAFDDVCLTHCGDGAFEAWIQVSNHGTSPVEGVVAVLSVEVGGELTEVARLDVGTLASGQLTEGLLIQVASSAMSEATDIVVRVEAPSSEELYECDDTNNVARWGEGLCS